MIDLHYAHRGFLPEEGPLIEFDRDSPLHQLDGLGHDLPSLLQDKGFRAWARSSRCLPCPRAPSH